ncbi:hypothetical protein MUSASHINO07_13670 [Gemella sp. Musashino-2025]
MCIDIVQKSYYPPINRINKYYNYHTMNKEKIQNKLSENSLLKIEKLIIIYSGEKN